MTSSTEWWSIGLGIGCVLIGLAVLIVCIALSGVLSRVGKTLDAVDLQISALGQPVATTLNHVGGIANTADLAIARLGVVVAQFEGLASNATRAAANVAGTVSDYTSKLRRPKPDDVTTGGSI